MAIQTTYDTDFAVALAGQRARFEPGDMTVSRMVAAGANVPAGRLLVKSTSDTLAKLPTSAAEMLRPEGVALYDASRRPGSYGSVLPTGETFAEGVPVLRRGAVWVQLEAGCAVTKGDPVFVRHTANGGLTALGAFRNTSDPAGGVDTAQQLPNASYGSTATAGALAVVELYLP